MSRAVSQYSLGKIIKKQQNKHIVILTVVIYSYSNCSIFHLSSPVWSDYSRDHQAWRDRLKRSQFTRFAKFSCIARISSFTFLLLSGKQFTSDFPFDFSRTTEWCIPYYVLCLKLIFILFILFRLNLFHMITERQMKIDRITDAVKEL